MASRIDWTMLDRYFAGDCTPSEAAVVARWAADPAAAEELETARRIWEEAGVVRARFDVDAAREAMRARMSGASVSARAPRFVLPHRGRRTWAIAAGIGALVVGGMIWRAVESFTPVAHEVAARREYAARPGERSAFRLPDGTRVMLGPGSRVLVPTEYGVRTREVLLEGQGYFDVVHDERRPFGVRAKGTLVRDLGTRFDVRAYTGESRVRVVVAEGQVALGGRVLAADQLGEIDGDARVTVQAGVDVDRYLAWTQGRLVFDGAPLGEALGELSRWYGVEFQLADSSLAALPLTATLRDRLTAETLDLLAVSLGVAVRQQGNAIVVGPGVRSAPARRNVP